MLIYIYVVRMDIEDTRKGIYLFKGNGSFLKELIPLSHIIVVLPSIMESPLVVRIQRNKIYGASSISYHNSEVQIKS